MPDSDKVGLEAVKKAISEGDLIFDEATKTDDFNKACDHVFLLLDDALACLERGSWGTSTFLSITAIEEIAKAEIGIYRNSHLTDLNVNRGKDKLYNHKAKHKIAVLPTVFMSQRLEVSLGKKRCKELLIETTNGEFTRLRESSLYFSRNNQFVTPADVISKSRAKELLLLAIETFDDRLVGYTQHSIVLSSRLDHIFEKVND